MPNANDERNDKEKKEANAFLRERFLYLLSSLDGKKCSIDMYENTQVSGKLKAFDNTFDHLAVEDLEVPHQECIKHAILRTSDIISISLLEKLPEID